MTDTKVIDLLYEDPLFKKYKYYSVSFISPEGLIKHNVRLLKVRGVYESYEEAKEHIVKLSVLEPCIPILVGELGKWCPWDQTPESIKQTSTENKNVNKLIEQYYSESKKANNFINERTSTTVNNASHKNKLMKEASEKK